MRKSGFLFVIIISMGAMCESRVAAEAGEAYRAMQTYRQTLIVKSKQGGQVAANPQAAKVFEGHKWALSTRWDDCHPNAVNVRKKMLAGGIRGTFYLNSRKPEKQANSLAYKLTGNGECSVGGHSVSHPRLTGLPANDAFYQLMANRIALEVLTDRPVNSLAFPYGAYQDKKVPEALHGITESVLRTGYQHCVYCNFVLANKHLPAELISTGVQVVPGDRQVNASKFWATLENVRKNEARFRKTSDCIFLGVHPWQQGEELTRLGEVMAKLHDWDDFWHCTQTEYAAFVRQYRNTTITPLAAGKFTIERPAAFELGSDVPLTLEFAGTDITGAEVDGIACALRQAGGKTFVSVPHLPRYGVPVKIDETARGVSAKFSGLKAAVRFDQGTGKVSCELDNATGAALSDVLLTVALPPAFEPGRLRRSRDKLAPADVWSVTAEVNRSRTGKYWQGGKHYVAAQFDFVFNGKRGRLFTTWTEK
jgi:hypothetical protein